MPLGSNRRDPRIRQVYIRPRSPHLTWQGRALTSDRRQDFSQLLDQGGVIDGIHLFNEKLRDHRPRRGAGWADMRAATLNEEI
jgi:hypothetical protein